MVTGRLIAAKFDLLELPAVVFAQAQLAPDQVVAVRHRHLVLIRLAIR